jgi:DNA polymerase-3 subunit alpha
MAAVARLKPGGASNFKAAGIVMGRRETSTRSGSRMAFVQLSDSSGVFEVTVFAELLATARQQLEPGAPMLMTIEAQPRDGEWRFTATAVEPLDAAVARAGVRLRVVVEEPAAASSLRSTLEREGKGRGIISVVVPIDAVREAEIALPGGWAVSARGRAAIKAIPGVADIQEI